MRSFEEFLKAKNQRPALTALTEEVQAYVAANAALGVTTAAVSERFFGGDRTKAKKALDLLKEHGRIRKSKYVWEPA